jgi:hypothetical protein
MSTEPALERCLHAFAARGVRNAAVCVLALGATVYYASRLGESYHIEDWLFWPTALLWLYNLVLFAAIVGTGHLVLTRVLRLELPALENLAISIPVGVVAFCWAMYGLGALHLYRTGPAAGLVAVLIAVSARPLFRFVRGAWRAWQQRAPRPPSLGTAMLAALVLSFGVICLWLLYLPLISSQALNFDATWYHLTVAQDYAREGRIIPFEGDYPRNWPQLAPIVHTWGWLMPVPGTLQRWTLPLHTEFFMVLGTLVGVAAMARYLLEPKTVRFAWVGFFLFPAVFVYDQCIAGGADHFLALFAPSLYLSAARTARTLRARRWALFGILAGGAILVRYQAVYLVVACGALPALAWLGHVLRGARRPLAGTSLTPREQLAGPLVGLAVATVAASPHFIANWVFYGNPVFPFLQNYFGGRPSVEGSARLVEVILKGDYTWRPQGSFGRRVAESLELMFSFSFEPHYSFTKNWLTFGSLFTLTLPLLPWLRSPGRILRGAGVALLALFVWAMTVRVDRHLQALAPILAACTVAALVRAWELGLPARVGVSALVALQVIWGGDAPFYSPTVDQSTSRLAAAVELVRSGYQGRVAERDDYRSEFVKLGKSLPKDAKVLLRPLPVSLGIDRRTVLDQDGHQGLISYAGIGGPTALKRYYQRLGITHIVFWASMPAWDKRAEILVDEFLRSTPISRFGGLSVASVEEARPRPDPAQYLVFAQGIGYYGDGLYALDDLGTWEPWDYPGRRFARPRTPLADSGEQLLARASAALIGTGANLDARTARILQRRFTMVHSYRDFRVYLLR